MSDSAAKPPNSHSEIIDLWPSLAEFSRDTGIPYETAKQMRRRNSIADEHRAVVVEKAAARSFDEVTFELLTRTAPRRGSQVRCAV
jgi:hypothetical protein